LRFTNSLHKNARLLATVQNWLGRTIAETEKQAFDFETLIGRPALISVIHTTQNGRTYANISSIIPLPDGMTAPQVDGLPTNDEQQHETPQPTGKDIAIQAISRLIDDLDNEDDDGNPIDGQDKTDDDFDVTT
jgi:hypothetical protein